MVVTIDDHARDVPVAWRMVSRLREEMRYRGRGRCSAGSSPTCFAASPNLTRAIVIVSPAPFLPIMPAYGRIGSGQGLFKFLKIALRRRWSIR
ncbi:hypothetical protein Arad_8736 [Rhizobium rhizogenes K84]|uniref:Uncharacterized protein n=1 Tax=Rhizobium rhizogenes (strain K84 / ATCC BAA-868) TaxID=311403 RepID=B9JJ46_RHIR8|nr:hypothetical protein Arad_8736 [Rhizobium rhizogenes K84]